MILSNDKILADIYVKHDYTPFQSYPLSSYEEKNSCKVCKQKH